MLAVHLNCIMYKPKCKPHLKSFLFTKFNHAVVTNVVAFLAYLYMKMNTKKFEVLHCLLVQISYEILHEQKAASAICLPFAENLVCLNLLKF